MNYVALKPVNFGGKQYKIGETIPEGVVDERRSLFLLGFKPVQHSGVSQKRNGTLMNK